MSQKDVSLGEFLRYERELRGVTIEQVASATKVGVRTLHALEADHYSELPAKPFIRGFVNSYCRFIGLDSKELLARFDDYINSKSSERPNREAGHSGYAFEKRDGEQQSRTLLLVAIFGFVVVGGVAIVFLKPSFHHSRASHLDKLRAAHGGSLDLPLADSKQGVVPNSSNATAQFIQDSPVTRVSPALGTLSSSSQPLVLAPEVTKPEVTQVSVTEDSSIAGVRPSSVAAVPAIPGPIEPKSSPLPVVQSANLKLAQQESEEDEEKPVKKAIPAAEKATLVSTKVTPLAEQNPADPLDSGLPLKGSEIHHKVIFKVLADIWVRYKVDGRPIRKFIIRKGNSLVLRAQDAVSFQVSNAKSLKFNYNSHGSKLLSTEKSATQQGTSTYFFPPRKSNQGPSPFEGSEPLPVTPDPVPDDEASLATGAKEPVSE